MKNMIQKWSPTFHDIFTRLHRHPEISWKEHNTTQYIHQLLQHKDCRLTTFRNTPGLIAEIGSGEPVVALRADMDALWQEVDGTFQANHSCGHDAHMTIAIGVLWTLLEYGMPKKGTFRFLFQPAEEVGEGALAFVEEGVMDDVDFLYGMHLRPIEELKHGQFAPAIQHGAAQFIDTVINGDDAHGARPHMSASAIEVGSAFLQHLRHIHINPMVPHSVKMTSFHAGGKSRNIIPGSASFSLDVRAQTNEVMSKLKQKVEDISGMLADHYHVAIDLQPGPHIAAAVLNGEAANFMQEAIADTVGKERCMPTVITPGGDDFHFYTIKRPHIKATMLAVGCDLKPGLHHPEMAFNHKAIPSAVEVLAKAMIDTAEHCA